jgi:hypothetical protein
MLAYGHHAPIYGQLGKTHLVAIEAKDNDEHPGRARDMQRLTENHRSSFKKRPEKRAWHLNQINPPVD